MPDCGAVAVPPAGDTMLGHTTEAKRGLSPVLGHPGRPMPDERPSRGPSTSDFGNRLWRVEVRQQDVIARLDKIEERQNARTREFDGYSWQLDALREKVARLEKGQSPEPGVGKTITDIFGTASLMRTVVLGLMALVAALVTGKLLDIVGLLH